MSTPTARSLDKLRKEGWSAAVVEKWVPAGPQGYKGAIITRDAFNFGDILAMRVGSPGAMLVQTTSGDHVSHRLEKIRGIDEARIWLAAGNRIQVHGWRKAGKAGTRKLWSCRVLEVDAAILADVGSVDDETTPRDGIQSGGEERSETRGLFPVES